MVTVRLSDNSSVRRLYINPKQEITREEGVAVPVKWAAIRLSDPNYFFVFEEADKEELLQLNDRFLQLFSKETGKEFSSNNDLIKELLPTPKKTILPKPSVKKSKTQNKSKSTLKK